MHFNGEPRKTHGIVQQLIHLPPKARIIAGILLMAAGFVVTVVLWDRGVIWGLPVFFAVVGFLLLLSGISAQARERNRRAFLASIVEHREELLGAMIDAKRQGRNPVRFLNEKGIHDAGIRGALIDEMNQRLKG